MNLAQHTVKLIRTGSRIYLSAAGLQTLHISILLTGAEYPYFDCSRHITMGSIAAKIHMQSMQFPNRNSMALCCRVIWLFETVDLGRQLHWHPERSHHMTLCKDCRIGKIAIRRQSELSNCQVFE